VPELAPLMRESLRYRGFKRAVLSSLRHQMPIENASETYAEVSRLGIPTRFLWGDEDQMTPPALIERVRQVMPRAAFRLFRGAGHLPQCEQPDAVAEDLVEGFQTAMRR
jgi:pimeloyl-ACP methyl ester carboxylesterase